jgi:hypothetical protein
MQNSNKGSWIIRHGTPFRKSINTSAGMPFENYKICQRVIYKTVLELFPYFTY